MRLLFSVRSSPLVETASLTLRLVPLTLREANALVRQLHRHHQPVQGGKFAIGAWHADKGLVGAVIVGRPVARGSDTGRVAEVTRLVTDGTRNACSLLYGAAARAAKAMGYDRIQTYTLASEAGSSLRAAGWTLEGMTAGGQWNHTSERQLRLDGGTRRTDQPTARKQRWAKVLTATPEAP